MGGTVKTHPGWRRRSISLIRTAIIGMIAWLVFSYLFPQDDLRRRSEPYATLVVIAFFGRTLTFHLGLLLAAASLAALGLKNRMFAGLAGLASLLALSPTVFSSLHSTPVINGPSFRVMSMNLKYEKADVRQVLSQIQMNQPDIITAEDVTGEAYDEITRVLGNRYPQQYLRGGEMAVWSRLPVDEQSIISQADADRRQLRFIVTAENQHIAIYAVHTFSPRTMERVISSRIATAQLLDDAKDETLPTLLVGDFNFTSESANAHAVKAAGFRDGFEAAGHGRGSTWPVRPHWLRWLPGARIDHAYLSAALACKRFILGEYDGSDHLPIVVDIAIRHGESANSP